MYKWTFIINIVLHQLRNKWIFHNIDNQLHINNICVCESIINSDVEVNSVIQHIALTSTCTCYCIHLHTYYK